MGGVGGITRYSIESPMSPDQPAHERCPIDESFPAALAGDVRTVMRETSATEGRWRLAVVVQGERVTLPYRIYADAAAPADAEDLSPVQREILACVFTRHFDGRVRERALRQVLCSPNGWVIPFVVQLVGEYVIEIHRVVLDALPVLNSTKYAAFLRENPAFYLRTRQRVMSYWNCYYRTDPTYWDRAKYPAFEVLNRFDAWIATPKRKGGRP
jgi:hypothetical protein